MVIWMKDGRIRVCVLEEILKLMEFEMVSGIDICNFEINVC